MRAHSRVSEKVNATAVILRIYFLLARDVKFRKLNFSILVVNVK